MSRANGRPLGSFGSLGRSQASAMLVGLHRLRIGEPIGAPKPASSSGGHGGVRLDSGRHTVAIILISRLLVSTDEAELGRIAQSRYGLVLLERMREVVLQLASPAAPSLQMAQVQTLFNTVGSTLKREGVYNGLLGLPSKLPFEQAKKVYGALLNAVASERGGDVGTPTVQLLRSAGNATGGPSAMADAVVANFAKRVREVATASLASGAEASASAQPPPPPVQPPPPSAAIVPTNSFLLTLENIAAAHVGHALSAAEHAQAQSAFEAAFNVLSSLGPSERAQLLHLGVLDALLDADAAQLYTCVLAAAKEGTLGETLDALLQRVDDQATAAAGAGMMLSAAGWGSDGIGAAHPIGLATASSIGVSTAQHLAPEPFLIDQSLTEVRASTIPGAGKGLFATRDIPAGMVVAGMEKSVSMKRSIWQDYHRSIGLPHDAAVYVSRSPLVFYDAAWTDPSKPPKWYRLNHSDTPNLFMGLLDPSKPPRSQALVWRTRRPIHLNEELFFAYEDAPHEW